MTSLGCAKNLVDSQIMVGRLRSKGFEMTSEEQEAEVLIVNTCGFIETAAQESVDAVLELASLKERGKCRGLILSGCLAEKHGSSLLSLLPEVDAVVGTGHFHEMPSIVERVIAGERVLLTGSVREAPFDDPHRVPLTPSHYAYLKIAEGCDHKCSFCTIPRMRGSFRSRPMESILDEAVRMSKEGVQEIVLIAQDTTAYGLDLYGEKRLPALLRNLVSLSGPPWIRLMYAYPNTLSRDVLTTIESSPKICRYLDIPLQHSNTRILKAMGRGGSRTSLLKLVGDVRKTVPGIALRTTLISGFPTERKKEFEELLSFVNTARFERLGAFSYSDEEQAASHALSPKVPASVKTARVRRLMETQQRIALERNEHIVGSVLEIMLDRVREKKSGNRTTWEGRTRWDAPLVDGKVVVKSGAVTLSPGDRISVRITGATPYDLLGVHE
ncbi:MAG: 30S ribosomal protein S12 methylthiotransferase RimO [Armatimonadetes bacterium]|nr:30S ribosomal protein S12 methylthiotransferase RimO [Armatimonadota bacterium]